MSVWCIISTYATVAQLVEQQIRNLQVGGSSPPGSSSFAPLEGAFFVQKKPSHGKTTWTRII